MIPIARSVVPSPAVPNSTSRRFKAVMGCAIVIITLTLSACKDEGISVPPPVVSPVISGVTPDSASVKDTITVLGSNFGASQQTSLIAIGGRTDGTVISWTSTAIRVAIPPGIRSATIIVTVNGVPSNTCQYTIKGFQQGQLSFALDIQPIFLQNCALPSCHQPPNPTSNFNASTYAGLRAGGFTFDTAVIIPGDSSKSEIMHMMRSNNNLIGLRMPLAGPYAATGLPDSLIVKIGTWIMQRALDN